MDQNYTQKIIEALNFATSPDKNLNEKAENFLLGDYQNIVYYQHLMQLTVDFNQNGKIRLTAVLILKKLIVKHFRDVKPEIQNLIKNNFLDMMSQAKSLKVVGLFSEILYKLLLIHPTPEKWPDFEEKLYNKICQNFSNLEVLYFMLKAYEKLSKTREHIPTKERKQLTVSISKFFPLLENLLTSLVQSEINQQNSEFIKVICKIFFKAYRYSVDDYMANSEKCSVWMINFEKILQNNNPLLYKAKKWISRVMLQFYRNFAHPEEEKQYKEFGVFWKNNFSQRLFDTFLPLIANYQIESHQNKVIYNISRLFYHFFKLKENLEKYKDRLMELVQQKFIKLVSLTQKDLETYEDDPIEYFKRNDIFIFAQDLRDAVTNMILVCANSFLLENMVVFYIQRLNSQISVLEKEAIFYIFQKISEKILKLKDSSFIPNFFEHHVIKEINAQEGFLRMRCCVLVDIYSNKLTDENLIKKLVETICGKLEDPDMPVRSYAAVALDKLLYKPFVIDMVRPHIKTILIIYIKLINECDNELLINSLTGIFESFNKELAPFVEELVEKLVNLILNIYQKTSKGNQRSEEEEQEFSILSAFQSIKELLKAPYQSTQIPSLYNKLEPVIVKIIQEQDLEVIEEIIDLINLLVFRSKKNQVYPALWKYFEFFSYALAASIPLNFSDKSIYRQNPLILELEFNRSNYDDIHHTMISVFRNFMYKDIHHIIKTSDGLGMNYLQLLMTALSDSKKNENKINDPADHAPIILFEGNLVLDLFKSNSLDTTNLLNQKIKELIGFYHDSIELCKETKRIDKLVVNIFWHNIGLFMCVNPSVVMEALAQNNLIQNSIVNWMDCHKELLTFRTRKASFLGLLSVMKAMQNDTAETKQRLVQFLLNDLIVQKVQNEREVKNQSEDFCLDDFDLNEEEEIIKQITTIENLKKFLSQMDNRYPIETEVLLNYEYDFVLEEFQHINPVNYFKQIVSETGMTADDLNFLLNQLTEEFRETAKKILYIN